MAIKSFQKSEAANITPETLVPVTETSTAVALPPSARDDVSGEITARDVNLPRINVVQKMSELSDKFAVGSVLFHKEFVLAAPEIPVNGTVLRIKKQYQLNVQYGGEDESEIVDTMAEVRERGGSLGYALGDWSELAHLQVVVEMPVVDDAPDGYEDMFPFSHNGKNYAVGVVTVARSGYTALAKPIFTWSVGTLQNGLHNGKFSFVTEKKTGPKGSWYVLAPKLLGKHSAEDAEFFLSLK